MTRVKCLRSRAYPGAPQDPILKTGRFYTVSDEAVQSIASVDGYIEIQLDKHSSIVRPRGMFGRFLRSHTTDSVLP